MPQQSPRPATVACKSTTHTTPRSAFDSSVPVTIGEPSEPAHTITFSDVILRDRPSVPVAADALALVRALDVRPIPDILKSAQRGTSGDNGPLPFSRQIQMSFGRHDVSGIAAHTDGAAAAACQEIGARAFAHGNHVAFASPPSMHTTAHEAAHVIQQRSGVHLKNRVGEVGDCHERHADAVADAVVAGRSAERLLDRYSITASAGGNPPIVQCLWSDTSLLKRLIMGDSLRAGPEPAGMKQPRIEKRFFTKESVTTLKAQLKSELDKLRPHKTLLGATTYDNLEKIASDDTATEDGIRAAIGQAQACQRGVEQYRVLREMGLRHELRYLMTSETFRNDSECADLTKICASKKELSFGDITTHLQKARQRQLHHKIPPSDTPLNLFDAIGRYETILIQSNARGVLQAPAFVLEQVFGKAEVMHSYTVPEKRNTSFGRDRPPDWPGNPPGTVVHEKRKVGGPSAANLDVGLSEAFIAHFDLLSFVASYITFLEKGAKHPALVANLKDLQEEINADKNYMYDGLAANRHRTVMNLKDAVTKGRHASGADDQSDISFGGSPSHGSASSSPLSKDTDALPVTTPLGLLTAASLPGFNDWTSPADRKRARWIEEGDSSFAGQPVLASLRSDRSLGNGTEGEVTLFSGFESRLRDPGITGRTEVRNGKDEVIENEDNPIPNDVGDPLETHEFAVKTTRAAGRDNLLREAAAYRHLGLHPNLPHVYGMAAVQFGDDRRPGLVMDFIRGPNIEKAMNELRQKVDSNQITKREYWRVVQFITTRLVDLVHHMAEKEIAHNDIKPENIVISESGEPILIDFGLHTVTGEDARGATKAFAPRALWSDKKSDSKTDLFMVAATMLAGAVGIPNKTDGLNKGWRQGGLTEHQMDRNDTWTPAKGFGRTSNSTATTGMNDTTPATNSLARANPFPGGLVDPPDVASSSNQVTSSARDIRREFDEFIDSVLAPAGIRSESPMSGADA